MSHLIETKESSVETNPIGEESFFKNKGGGGGIPLRIIGDDMYIDIAHHVEFTDGFCRKGS